MGFLFGLFLSTETIVFTPGMNFNLVKHEHTTQSLNMVAGVFVLDPMVQLIMCGANQEFNLFSKTEGKSSLEHKTHPMHKNS